MYRSTVQYKRGEPPLTHLIEGKLELPSLVGGRKPVVVVDGHHEGLVECVPEAAL